MYILFLILEWVLKPFFDVTIGALAQWLVERIPPLTESRTTPETESRTTPETTTTGTTIINHSGFLMGSVLVKKNGINIVDRELPLVIPKIESPDRVPRSNMVNNSLEINSSGITVGSIITEEGGRTEVHDPPTARSPAQS